MALNFPANPATNDSYTEAGKTWYYTGSSWQLNTVVTSPYLKWAIQDENSAKYTVYNGYDRVTNPNPDLDDVPFNKWVLNNSTNLPLIVKTGVVEQVGNFNTVDINIANLAVIDNIAADFVASKESAFATNNGFLYIGSFNNGVFKYYQSNLALVGNTTNSGGVVAINNGFIYASNNNIITRFNETTLDFVDNSPIVFTGGLSNIISTLKINDGFIYVGSSNGYFPIKKYYESNLTLVGDSSIDGSVTTMYINDGFIFAAGGAFLSIGDIPDNYTIRKYYESNLTLFQNTPVSNQFSLIKSLTGNNGYLYVSQPYIDNTYGLSVKKYFQSNLGFVGNTPVLSNLQNIDKVKINSGYIYLGGANVSNPDGLSKLFKYDENTLELVAETDAYVGAITGLAIDNNYLFVGRKKIFSNVGNDIYKHQEFGLENVTVNLYSITNIKGGL